MDRNCPICHKQLVKDHKIMHVDFHCSPPAKDHHYAVRLKDEVEEKILRIKVRVTEPGFNAFLHVHYDDGFSEIWTQPNQIAGRVRLDYAIETDFSNLTNLKNKLKTYLLFS